MYSGFPAGTWDDGKLRQKFDIPDSMIDSRFNKQYLRNVTHRHLGISLIRSAVFDTNWYLSSSFDHYKYRSTSSLSTHMNHDYMFPPKPTTIKTIQILLILCTVNIMHLNHSHPHHNHSEPKHVYTLSSDVLHSLNILLLYLSPLCRLLTITYLKYTMRLGYIVLQSFCTCKWATRNVTSHDKYVLYGFICICFVLSNYYYYYCICKRTAKWVIWGKHKHMLIQQEYNMDWMLKCVTFSIFGIRNIWNWLDTG